MRKKMEDPFKNSELAKEAILGVYLLSQTPVKKSLVLNAIQLHVTRRFKVYFRKRKMKISLPKFSRLLVYLIHKNRQRHHKCLKMPQASGNH